MARQTTRLEQSTKLRLTTQLVASIRILAYDSSGLTRYLEEQAAENPHLALAPVEPAPGEWLPRWHTAFAAAARIDPREAFIEAAPPGMTAHALAELARLCPTGRARSIGLVLVQALEPSGWLGRPLATLAQEAAATLPEAEAVLHRLQQAEPTGLFARSLAECLRLQAREAGHLDPVMACVLDNLDLLARGDLGRLAKLCDVSPDAVARCQRRIRSYDPKPGARFGQGAAPVREPDLIATFGPKGWSVTLNRSSLPEVKLRDAVVGGSSAGLAAAKALQHVVRSRNATLLRVGAEILRRQAASLTHGAEALVPMTMTDVAAALEVHQSTISRTVAGVSVDTPRGTVWLRSLFSGPVAGRDAGGGSTGHNHPEQRSAPHRDGLPTGQTPQTARPHPPLSSGGPTPDTGLANSGLANSGLSNAGLANSGTADLDPAAIGPADTGLSDTGLSDTGLSDTGLSFSGLSNSGLSNSGLSNSGLPNSGPAAIGPADTEPDTDLSDTDQSDSGLSYTGPADIGLPDADPRGTGLSGAALRARLARLIGQENPASPLSDQHLCALLAGEGAAIARRTVAKYREMLHIPPAHRRRLRD